MITNYLTYITESKQGHLYREILRMIEEDQINVLPEIHKLWQQTNQKARRMLFTNLLDVCIEKDRSMLFIDILESDQMDPEHESEKALFYQILAKIIKTNKLHFLDHMLEHRDKFINILKDPYTRNDKIKLIGHVIKSGNVDLFERLVKEDLFSSNIIDDEIGKYILESGNPAFIEIIVEESGLSKHPWHMSNYLGNTIARAVEYANDFDTQKIITFIHEYAESRPELELNYVRRIWGLCVDISLELTPALRRFIQMACDNEIDPELVYHRANEMGQNRFEQHYEAMCSDSAQEDDLLDIF